MNKLIHFQPKYAFFLVVGLLRVGAPTSTEVILRLNLTVKASTCVEPGLRDLADLHCSGKGKCVTEPSQVNRWHHQCTSTVVKTLFGSFLSFLLLVPNYAILSSVTVEFSLTFENHFIKFHRANTVLRFYRALSSVSVRTDTSEASVRNLMPATPDPVATTAPAPTVNRGSMGAISPAPAPQVCSAWGHLSVCVPPSKSTFRACWRIGEEPRVPRISRCSAEILFGSTTDRKPSVLELICLNAEHLISTFCAIDSVLTFLCF